MITKKEEEEENEKDKGEEGKRKRMRKGKRNSNYDSSKSNGIQVPGWGCCCSGHLQAQFTISTVWIPTLL